MASTPTSIFISDSRRDSIFVDQLAAELKARSFLTKVDRRRIEINQPWKDISQSVLDHSGVLLVVLTPTSISCPQVQMEYVYTLRFITLVAVFPLWTPSPKGEVMIDLTNNVVATYFTATPDGQWQCTQTGFIVRASMLNFYKSYGQNAYCGLTYLGLPKSNEIPITEYVGVVKQEFERGWLVYDPQHQFDNPPGAGEVYPMHLPQ